MGGFFGCASQQECNKELFYGTDYLSHLGTKRGGIATVDKNGFHRTIHNLENAYFRSKFESDIDKLTGNMGIGVISDTESQSYRLFISPSSLLLSFILLLRFL